MGGWEDEEVRGQGSVEGEYEKQKSEEDDGEESLRHSNRARS